MIKMCTIWLAGMNYVAFMYFVSWQRLAKFSKNGSYSSVKLVALRRKLKINLS